MAIQSSGKLRPVPSFAGSLEIGADAMSDIDRSTLRLEDEAKIVRHAHSMCGWYRNLIGQLELDPALPEQSALIRPQVIPLGLSVVTDSLGASTNVLLVRVRNSDGQPISFHDSVGLVFPNQDHRVLQQIICPVSKSPNTGATVQTLYSDLAFKYEIKNLGETGVIGFLMNHQRGALFRLLREAVTSAALTTIPDFDPANLVIYDFQNKCVQDGRDPNTFRVESSFGNFKVVFKLHTEKRLPFFTASLVE
jgi:hypothetical protein